MFVLFLFIDYLIFRLQKRTASLEMLYCNLYGLVVDLVMLTHIPCKLFQIQNMRSAFFPGSVCMYSHNYDNVYFVRVHNRTNAYVKMTYSEMKSFNCCMMWRYCTIDILKLNIIHVRKHFSCSKYLQISHCHIVTIYTCVEISPRRPKKSDKKIASNTGCISLHVRN